MPGPASGAGWARAVHWRGPRWGLGRGLASTKVSATSGSGSVSFAQVPPFTLRVDVRWWTVSLHQVRVANSEARYRQRGRLCARGAEPVPSSAVACPSGLRSTPRKRVWAQVHPGFESLRHRQ